MSYTVDLDIDFNDLNDLMDNDIQNEELTNKEPTNNNKKTKKNNDFNIPLNNDIKQNETVKQDDKDDKDELSKLRAYINNIHYNFKDKVGKEPKGIKKWSIDQCNEHIKEIEGKCYGKNSTYIDGMYEKHNYMLELGGSMIIGNMDGLKKALDNNEDLKIAFKLMILKRFNIGYMSPEMRYLYGVVMTSAAIYSANQFKNALQQTQPNNEPTNEPLNNPIYQPTQGFNLSIPKHILEAQANIDFKTEDL